MWHQTQRRLVDVVQQSVTCWTEYSQALISFSIFQHNIILCVPIFLTAVATFVARCCPCIVGLTYRLSRCPVLQLLHRVRVFLEVLCRFDEKCFLKSFVQVPEREEKNTTKIFEALVLEKHHDHRLLSIIHYLQKLSAIKLNSDVLFRTVNFRTLPFLVSDKFRTKISDTSLKHCLSKNTRLQNTNYTRKTCQKYIFSVPKKGFTDIKMRKWDKFCHQIRISRSISSSI